MAGHRTLVQSTGQSQSRHWLSGHLVSAGNGFGLHSLDGGAAHGGGGEQQSPLLSTKLGAAHVGSSFTHLLQQPSLTDL